MALYIENQLRFQNLLQIHTARDRILEYRLRFNISCLRCRKRPPVLNRRP